MRSILIVPLALSLAGCKAPLTGSVVELTVSSPTPMTVARLHLAVTAAARQEAFDVALGAIPPARTVAISFPPAIGGAITIVATAYGSDGRILGSSTTSETLHGGGVVPLAIAFGEATHDLAVSGADLGQPPGDMTGAGDLGGASGCGAGAHQCNGTCTANTSIASCGVSCTPCVAPTGGSATCDGTQCGGSCPNGMQLCAGSCIADGQACNGTCPNGEHACNGLCEDVTSVNACGTSCSPCSAPASNGTATCDGTMCGISCGNNFRGCQGNCIPSSGCCVNGDCTSAPANATPICTVANTCDWSCNSGYAKSGNGCDIAAPQPIAPMSTSRATSQQPTLRWALASGTNGAHLDVCTSRACTSTVVSVDVAGASYKTAQLAAGTYYWRLRGRIGSTTGTLTSPVWQLLVPAGNPSVSTAWGSVLDFNGDGIADVAVGAMNGSAYVYRGGASVGNEVPITLSGGSYFGSSTASAGDVNGDGFGDLALAQFGGNITVYLGSAGGLQTTPLTLQGDCGLNYSGVASAGDVNGDGYGDLIAGSQFTNDGSALVFLGGPNGPASTPSQTISPPVTNAHFGWWVSGGDFNADGYGDVLISAPADGTVYVYYGSASGLSAQPTAISGPGGAFLGVAASVGDVNGDGYPDAALGAPNMAAYIYLGGAGGLATTPSWTLLPPSSTNSNFAASIKAAGDVNGDGFDDVVVGSDSAALIYTGAKNSFSTTGTPATKPAESIIQDVADVGGLGDVDNDGLDDVAAVNTSVDSQAGIVWIFTGNKTSVISASPTYTINGQPSSQFGESVN